MNRNQNFIERFSDSKLTNEVVDQINRLATSGDCSVYSLIDKTLAAKIAAACAASGAKTSDDAYAVYQVLRTMCVVQRYAGLSDSTDVTGPVRFFTRPHYGDSKYRTRELYPNEVARILANLAERSRFAAM